MSILKYKDPATGEVRKVGMPVAIGKTTVVNTTLLASGWVDGTYTVLSESITDTSAQEVIPAVDITPEQLDTLQKINLQDFGQSAGSIILKAYGKVPTIDIPIRIVVSGLDVVAAPGPEVPVVPEEPSILPEGYIQLKYIQSTGTQYIDTGVGYDHKIEIDVIFFDIGTSDQLMGQSTSGGYYFGINGAGYLVDGRSQAFSYLGTERRPITIVGTSTSQTVTVGTETLTQNRANIDSSPVKLLGGLQGYACSARLYSCQIYTNDTLIRDYVPSKNPNGDIGLYDIVNNKFYGNAGTGVFIDGPIVYNEPVVGALETEEILLITENGIPTEYYIAKHGYEAELNGANRTLLRRKESHSARVWDSDGSKDYATSDVDAWMNGDFYNSLSAGVRDIIGATTFYYTDINANVNTLDRAVFLLSVAELGLTHSNGNSEGSVLPIASTLQIANLNGTASNQWTRSVYKTTNPYVCFLTTSGAVNSDSTEKAYGVPVAFTIPSDTKVVGPDTHGRYTLETEIDPNVNIYGIYRDITASSPAWARCDKAGGKVATASVGTVAGHSDFDDCYPWSEIKRETLPTGDVMVKIPKFWYQRARSGNMEIIRIADAPTDGFNLHPAFNHAGVEQDCIYVGAYKCDVNTVSSVPGAKPHVSVTRAAYRTHMKNNKPAGFHLLDISTLSAIQMLYLVEFANNNSQETIGRGYCDGNSASLVMGTCDTVPNLTGRPAGTDGKTDVVYRGIEGLWGNILEFIDGINYNGGTYYVCNDPSKYADDTAEGYAALSYTGPVVTNYQYITKMGLDENGNPDLILPQTADGGSETTYYCDAMISTTGWCVCVHGMSWSGGSQAGIFMSRLNAASSLAAIDFGSRIIYIPQ